MSSLKWRGLIIAAIMVVTVIYLVPTFSSTLPPWWTKALPKERIHLGLDLQGGMHLVLEVQTLKAVENALERTAEEIKDALRNAQIGFRKVERSGSGWGLDIQLTDAQKQESLRKLVDEEYPTLSWVTAESSPEGVNVRLAMKDAEVQHTRKMAEEQALETIRNRIDQFGVSEADIRPQGEDRILVQLPGIQDTQRAIDLIGKTALLEFKLVADSVTTQDIQSGKIPAGVRVYPMKRADSSTGQVTESKIALKDKTLMTGQGIANAQVRIDSQYNTPFVGLDFDPQGGRQFERITEENVKKRLAIVLDGVVYSAPEIQEKITGGKATITGSFSMQEARDLSIVLRAGALPAPVKIEEQRTVGPSLGSDSIRMGLLASLVGGIAVVLFMIVYYRLSGVIANLALVLNILIVLAGLAAFQATLTLPGIAGMALTIAIAVDANVLIYERIREELRLGKTPRAAIETGYDRASWTIIDANLTTLIAAVVLFQFGTGPVKGFAVTLSIGLLANLFTAIVVTRVIFDYLLAERRMKTLSI